jgi:hypothetical protein
MNYYEEISYDLSPSSPAWLRLFLLNMRATRPYLANLVETTLEKR